MFTQKRRPSPFGAFRRPAHLAALFVVIGMLAAMSTLPVFAMPRDPIDPPPIGGGEGEEEPYVAPANGFDWSVPARFGLDVDPYDHMIDYHWRDSNDPQFPNTYEPTHIYPNVWPIVLDGCRTGADEAAGTSSDIYVWHIHGQGGLVYDYAGPVNDYRCRFEISLPAQGNYKVEMTIYDPTGEKVWPDDDREAYEQPVYIKDYLIVSIGDSYASGEGNPDIPNQAYPPTTVKWQDARCHRSAIAGPAKAALEIERSDPHTSVTFLSFACSGATVGRPVWDPIGWDWVPPFYFLEPDEHKARGTGILGRYRGQEVPDNYPYPPDNFDVESYEPYLPSQIDQLETALTPPDSRTPRTPDALIMSAGGNDVFFGEIAMACVVTWDCWANANMFESPGNGGWTIKTLIRRALGTALGSPDITLPGSYGLLSEALDGLTVNGVNVKPLHIYATEYPDWSRDDNGNYCRMLDDILWPNPFAAMESWEAEETMTFGLKALNDTLKYRADMYGWTYVDGMARYLDDPTRPVPIITGPDGKGHGYCATDNWIRRADESAPMQGPSSRKDTKGTLHPTARAHQIYEERILHYMAPDLAVQLPANPPQFQTSLTVDPLTSFATVNGWFIKSCTGPNGTGTCEDKVVLKVTANADANATATLHGATSTVNGAEACPAGAVCSGPLLSNNNKTATWTYALAADGIYHFNFTAQDSTGQTASFVYQLKADLHDPQLTAPAPLTVDEGGSVVLQAEASDAGGGAVDLDWDVNNDGEYETTDEQPTFSAAALDGPVEQTVGVRAKDMAGRMAATTTTVSVSNVAPTLSNLATDISAVDEGGSVTLTGDISDASSADSFSVEIDWGDGSAAETLSPPAGSTSFSVAHTYADDDPTGTASDTKMISVGLSDDDGATVSQSTTVTVNNQNPMLTITGPSENTLFPLTDLVNVSATLTDAGVNDALSCEIAWDDGTTTAGTIAAGACTASKTYAAPGIYSIQVTVADDDLGSDTETVMIVVYDPSAGFVTGAGHLDSPAGAYTADPRLTGPARFAFVSKYRKGAQLPEGQTQFVFSVADFRFDATAYEWLVVAGPKAQYKGTGTVNGAGSYSFLLTATDGQINGGGDVDKFRIKIWDAAGVAYDNVLGRSDDMDGANPQAITVGSIVIHK